MKILM